MVATRRKTLPAVGGQIPSELRPLLSAISEMLETGQGVRGNKLDRNLTLRDMLDSNFKLRIPGNPDSGLEIVVPTQPPDLTRPPVPTGFAAVGTFFGMVNISWDMPFEAYRNHAFTNIYRSESDNFANAVVIGREAQGGFYTDYVRSDALDSATELELKGHYYWITFVSTSGIEGAPNASAGTFAKPLPDATYLLEQLSGQLGESELEQALRSRLDGIETNQTAITQQQKVIQGLSALYTLKLNVNGYISGFGAYNDGRVADFAVLADRFWISRPGVASSAVKPFMVINGKVYMDSAFIREASIQEGQLGPITFGKIFDPAGRPVTSVGGKLKADYIEVDELLAAILRADTAFIRNAHIRNAEIDTLKIQGNAITVPEFAQGSSLTNIGLGGQINLITISVWMPDSGAGILIGATCNIGALPAGSKNSECYLNVLVNGAHVAGRQNTARYDMQSSIAFSCVGAGRPGWNTITLVAINPNSSTTQGGTLQCILPALSVMAAKR